MRFWDGPNLTGDRVTQLHERKNDLYREIIATKFSAMEGAFDLIASLHEAGFRLAIASSGPRENAQLVLDRLGVRSLIGVQITGDDVERGKPDPQVFALAARGLGVEAGCCAVIEDAPVGIAAANAAGMVCIGLVGFGRSAADLASASLIVPSLNELSPQIIHELIAAHQ